MKLTYDNGKGEVLVTEFTTYSELIKAIKLIMAATTDSPTLTKRLKLLRDLAR